MTSRELAKLARHIIQTYPDYYKFYGEREFTCGARSVNSIAIPCSP